MIDTLPVEYVPAARRHLAEAILHLVADRDAEEKLMRTLGAQGEAIFAHRQATTELRNLATKWASS